MRNLLLLALLLYDIVAKATRIGNYDYEDLDGNKRHNFIDERRNWRKKALMQTKELNHKDWEDRRRHDYEGPRYPDDMENKGLGYGSDIQADPNYNKKPFEDMDKATMPLGPPKSNEMGYGQYVEKDNEKKIGPANCDRPNERYEACFAGCASVTCDNPHDRLRPCYPFCEPGCVCVPPYVRDDRTHKCVLPDECTRGLKGIPDLDET